MTDLYPYLVASLPTLHFGMKPPFTFEQFCEMAHRFIPGKDFEALHTLPLPPQYSEEGDHHPVIRKWIEFDTALRNELVRIRADKRHVAPAAYLRPERYSGPSLAPVAMAANANPSIISAEEFLDEKRWKFLDDLATGHYFDLGALIVYSYKLMILQRWERIRNADRKLALEQALAHLKENR